MRWTGMRWFPRTGWAEAGAVAAALLLGAWLRLNSLEYAQFRPDDEALWSLAKQLLEHPRALTRGIPSSFGLSNGPFQVYLLSPGAALSAGPIGAYYTVALLNLVALVVAWRFVRFHWGASIAVATLIFAATNPWAVVFSRRLLGNDLVAPFTVLLVAALSSWLARGRGRDLVLAFLWLAVAIQTYVVALLHLALMAVGLVLGRQRVRMRPVLLGAALLAIVAGPYLARSTLRELDTLGQLYGAGPASVDLDSLRLTLHLVSTEAYQAFAAQIGGTIDATSGWPLVVSVAMAAAMVVGMGTAAVEAGHLLRQGDRAAAAPRLLGLIAVLLPAILLFRHATPLHPYYFVSGLPMPYLFAAIGLAQLSRALGLSAARPALGVMVVAITCTNLLLAQLFFGGIREFWSKGDYGLPMAYTFELASIVRGTAGEISTDRVFVVGGNEHAGVLHRVLERSLPTSTVFDPGDSLVVPAVTVPTALYALAEPAAPIAVAIATAPESREVATFAIPGEGLTYRLIAASPARLDGLLRGQVASASSATFDGRVALVGASTSQLVPGSPEQLTLAWSLPQPLRAGTPELVGFARLVDTEDRPLGGRDFRFFSTAQWQAGDRFVQWLSMDVPSGLPAGAYAYRVGLYSVDPVGAYQVLPVLDPTGQLAGETVRLGWRMIRPPPGPEPSTHVDASLGDAVKLAGYDLRDSGCAVPRQLELTLHWTSARTLDRDYTVFVHAVGSDGSIVAQHDAQPAGGRFPTSSWPAGERIVDAHALDLGTGTEVGVRLLVGLYHQPSGERLGGPGAAIALPTGPSDCPRA